MEAEIKGRHRSATPPSTKNWTRENLAWAAGLFEGEGCLTPSRSKGRSYPRMRMTSTDLDVLERFQAIVGCGAIRTAAISPGSAARGTAKQPYVWDLGGRLNVYALGVAMFTWFGERRRTKFIESTARASG